MSVEYKKSVAVFQGSCTIEDAEPLLAYLLNHPKAKVNLRKCSHVHSAVLQVLMCAKPKVSSPPENSQLAAWLLPLLAETIK